METVLSCFDVALGFIGIPANIILIVATIAVKDSHLKVYSVILGNSAVTDFLNIVLELMSMPRMIADFPYMSYIFEGFCTNIGTSVCQVSFQLELHLMLHSFILIAISFWYRSTVLASNSPSRANIQILICVVLIPTLFSISIFSWTTDSLRLLPISHPGINITNIAHSASKFDDYRMIFIIAYCACTPIVAYGFIFYFKEQVNNKMRDNSENMSDTTRAMHQSLIKALTYHSRLPLLFLLGILLFFAQTMGVQNAAIERAVFLLCTIPSAINPIFTLYFVRSYRRFIILLLRFGKIESGAKIVPSNEI